MLLGIVVFDTCHLCNCRIFTQLTWCIFVTYGPIIIWRLDSATSQNTLLCCFVDMFVWHAVYYDCLKSTRLWTTVNYSCFIVPRHCFLGSLCLSIQGGPRKRGHRLMTIILSNLNRLKKNFTVRFPGKFAVKWIFKIPLQLAYVATLPCEPLTTLQHMQGEVRFLIPI